jgi:uncharacterized iron-regulated protein
MADSHRNGQEAVMRILLFLGGILVVAAGLQTPAHAESYPWCADYGGAMGGSSNCGFTTYDQCMATISGMGGFCDRNTQYQPSASVALVSPRPRRLRLH